MPPRGVITGRSQEPRRRYAEELRRLRHARGLSLRQLADAIGWDASLFGKLETGSTLGSPDVAEALDQFYGTPGLLLAMWEMAIGDPTAFKEKYRRYIALEAEAVNFWHFGVSTVHGLLQTERYARELLKLGGVEREKLEQQVEARTSRRKLLEGEGAPPFRSIIAEAALCARLPDMNAWREQLEYLLEVSERPNITLQVLPQTARLHGLVSTDVMFLRLLDGSTVAYTENAHRGELVEGSAAVEQLQRAYDAMRDQALSPAESRKSILRMLEEVPCDPESST
ncbi:transcriptional regulator [Streptomyces hygroscopicus subsp. hygroscopicus]|nr:helix-turn-helix transcriptional regulator [Streptomyces hygroscopicus]GLX54508.1 transcriptional regulator [Streptomyces hygroscopicus subsp. hygroscopicus]